jgi:hypothetical protein
MSDMKAGADALSSNIEKIVAMIGASEEERAALSAAVSKALAAADALRKLAKSAGIAINASGKPRGRKPRAKPMTEPAPAKAEANGGDPMPEALRRSVTAT